MLGFYRTTTKYLPQAFDTWLPLLALSGTRYKFSFSFPCSSFLRRQHWRNWFLPECSSVIVDWSLFHASTRRGTGNNKPLRMASPTTVEARNIENIYTWRYYIQTFLKNIYNFQNLHRYKNVNFSKPRAWKMATIQLRDMKYDTRLSNLRSFFRSHTNVPIIKETIVRDQTLPYM